MARLLLQSMVDDIQYDALPVNWTSFDLKAFSSTKDLWDYQEKSVQNAIKVLWKYYDDLKDYDSAESLDVNQERKERLFQWFRDNGLDGSLDIGLDRANRTIAPLLSEYYPVEDRKVSYEHFINRMCFWMATGSGKTLVIVKLIEVLRELIRRAEIPAHDILVLTYRDDLIEQLKRHVDEFNSARGDFFIRLKELKQYAAAKRDNSSLFKEREVTVFYYRSDNLSDEQKEKIVDFRNYDDEGKWYVLLDEAHKGDKEDSKRQHIYSILSRNGFLFNFSATFTDPRDRATTAFNFNLSEFTKAGYGKHIGILKQEMRPFRDQEDYNGQEKQKVVLNSLIMLAYVSSCWEGLRALRSDLYHRPLLLTLVNSVDTKDADLKLFFRQLERIGKAEISQAVWHQAKQELWDELSQHPALMFEAGQQVHLDRDAFETLHQDDILRLAYNSTASGDIEVLLRPSNRRELAFKLKTSDKPFALIKIGDISRWLKEELGGYEVNESFDDESFFERLNADDSDINVLMGSRAFYEGWDSNRPNVLNYINIGVGTDARKFILQSIGRGVRIEPLKNKRKRLLPLYNAVPREIEEHLFHRIKDKVLPVETLFVFGTNREALLTVIEQLDTEKEEAGQDLSLFVNEEAIQGRKLLIPTYRRADQPLVEQKQLAKLDVAHQDLDLLTRYVQFVGDDRVLLAIHETDLRHLQILRDSLAKPDDYYKQAERSLNNIDLLVRRSLGYFSIIPEEFRALKELEDEIRHFKAIRVHLKDITDLRRKADQVRGFPTSAKTLKEQYGKIPAEEYDKRRQRISSMEHFTSDGKTIDIKYVANHYYVPLIMSQDEKIDYIKHVIKTPSERKFINKLEEYVKAGNTKFKEFDWWVFSKLDETLDEVYIPYYDPNTNKIRRFNPDFVFWLQKGEDYFVLFIDPKGTTHTDYEHKVDGFKMIFEGDNGAPKVLDYGPLRVSLLTLLFTDDVNLLSDAYKRYWFDSIQEALGNLLAARCPS